MQSAKRILLCTVTALASGLFGGYLGSKISRIALTARCLSEPKAMSALCQVQGVGLALWQGSTAGLWTGTILGAAFAGAIISEKRHKELDSSTSDPQAAPANSFPGGE